VGVTIKAQELNIGHVEQALLGFGVQVILIVMLQDVFDMTQFVFQ